MALNNLTTMTEFIKDSKQKGFDREFYVKDEVLRSFSDDKNYTPENVHIVDIGRFEGESNPSDEAVVYLVSCDDGRKGILTNAYGASYDAATNDFMKAVSK